MGDIKGLDLGTIYQIWHRLKRGEHVLPELESAMYETCGAQTLEEVEEYIRERSYE